MTEAQTIREFQKEERAFIKEERAFEREFEKINKKFLVDEINAIASTKFTPSPIAPPEAAQDYLQLRYLFQDTYGYELANGKNQPSCLCLVVDKKGKR